jgi:Chondroitinase B
MIANRRNVLYGLVSLPASRLLAGRSVPGLNATVYNGFELQAALQMAGPNSIITLASGSFGDAGRFVLSSTGVSIRVRSPLQTVLHAPMVIRANGVELQGLSFGSELLLVGAGLVIGNSVFRGAAGVNITGIGTEVSYCEFAGFTGVACRIRNTAKNAFVHHNYFHDSQGSGNGHEGIQIAQSLADTDKKLNALVEYNLLELCNAESEAISVKSSANMIRFNTLQDSKANLVNRHGERNVWAGNTILRSWTITVHDRGQPGARQPADRLAQHKGHGRQHHARYREDAGAEERSPTSDGHLSVRQ